MSASRQALHLHAPAAQPVAQRAHNVIDRLHEEFKRRIKTQTVLASTNTAAMLGFAGISRRHHNRHRRGAHLERCNRLIRRLR